MFGLPDEAAKKAGRRGRGKAARKEALAKFARDNFVGRKVYLPDTLFERIMVHAHRRGETISQYVTVILDRQVPDHLAARGNNAEQGTSSDAA